MNLKQKQFADMFRSSAALLLDNVNLLSEIDSRFGDGDHGVTIEKIAKMIIRQADEWGDKSLKEWFDGLNVMIMGISGGSAGPLYGTLIGGFAVPLTEETTEVDAALLKRMFAGVLEEMQSITNAKVGDKTMMDALIPAVEAAEASPDDIKAILENASAAAQEGAENSRNFASKFGRARSYKEKTIGTPDAGAVSTSLLFRGLAEGL